LPTQPAATEFIALVRRGTCKFVEKAEMAQKAGAVGLFVILDDDNLYPMGAGNESADLHIFVVSIRKSFGDKLLNASVLAQDSRGQAPIVSVELYTQSLFNISQVLLVLLATSLVALGAWFSTADLGVNSERSFSQALAPDQEEVMHVDTSAALGFFFFGSCMLMVMFFFMHYMIYVIMAGFCLGGCSCITQFGAICLKYFGGRIFSKSFPAPGLGSVQVADIVALIPGIVLVVAWVHFRNTPYGWPFQDIIGAGFLCWLQRTLRLPNMKIATLFLSAMFFFDIFWVFISPYFFQESVMVRVATGGSTGESVPMLLRLPAFGDPLGSDRLLGFGDIALPGLLVSYCRRFDLANYRPVQKGFFLPVLTGYFVGLCLTMVALMIMRMGQPALLYLVPCTLGTTLVLAACRGEARSLWEGKMERSGCIAEERCQEFNLSTRSD